MSGKVARGIRKFADKNMIGQPKETTKSYYKGLKSFYTSNHNQLMNFKKAN